jgi:hypothetical protein
MENNIENILKTGASQLAVIGAEHKDLLPNLEAMLSEYREVCEVHSIDLEDLPATVRFLISYSNFITSMAKFAAGEA